LRTAFSSLVGGTLNTVTNVLVFTVDRKLISVLSNTLVLTENNVLCRSRQLSCPWKIKLLPKEIKLLPEEIKFLPRPLLILVLQALPRLPLFTPIGNLADKISAPEGQPLWKENN
jgi:hypothetical protein